MQPPQEHKQEPISDERIAAVLIEDYTSYRVIGIVENLAVEVRRLRAEVADHAAALAHLTVCDECSSEDDELCATGVELPIYPILDAVYGRQVAS